MGDLVKPVKLPLFSTVIKKDGIIDLEGLYKIISSISKNHGYSVKETEHVKKVEEGKIEIGWKLEKKSDNYFKFEIEIKIQCLKCRDVMVERKGKKLQRIKTEALVTIKATLIKNYKSFFGTTKMQDFLRRMYETFVKYALLKRYGGELIDECSFLSKKIKEGLEQFD